MARLLALLASIVLSLQAPAKTASEVFEAVADSVVVVVGRDGQGKESLGSGVVIGAGEVVTNCHVIDKARTIVVRHRQREYAAARKHADADRDVCSVSVAGLDAPAAALGGTRGLKVGQKVFAVGAPQGLELSLSEGIIASLREIAGGRYLQITAPISAGSSGGGLFDEQGRLIGLPTFYLAEGQQLNFAIPVEWVRELPQRHAAAGRTARPAGRSSLEWLNEAARLQEKKDWPGLARHAQDWIRARPKDAQAWWVLGIAYGNSGQTAKAIEAYRQALRIDPQDAFAWNNLGDAYNDAGQPAKAIEALQQALRIDPQLAVAWYNLGVAYDKSGQTAEAIEAYQQALRIDPQDAAAWNNLGNAYYNSGQPAKAIEAYRQALRIDPQHANAWNNLGVAYNDAGQTAKAIEALQQALRIDPQDAAAWYNLGIAYRKSGQTAKAIEAYQQALRIDPQLAAAWYNLGIAYRNSGNRGQVTEVYQRLKALDPKLADEFFGEVLLP